MIRNVFGAIRPNLAPDALVVQLVGFADVISQLPVYQTAMQEAGFEEWIPPAVERDSLWRRVPNRKWYANLQGDVDPSSELLLFHRPKRRAR
jgi:hypothetical protein